MSTTNPTPEEVEGILEDVDRCSESLNYPYEPIIIEVEGGPDHPGRLIQRGDVQYRVIATVGQPLLAFQASFDAVEAVARERAADNGPQSPNTPGGQVPPTHQQRAQARQAIRSETEGRSHRLRVRQELMEKLYEGSVTADLIGEDDGPFVWGFTVDSMMNPYGDGVGVEEFEAKTRTIVNRLHVGKEYLVQEYNLRDLSGGGPGSQGPGMYQ